MFVFIWFPGFAPWANVVFTPNGVFEQNYVDDMDELDRMDEVDKNQHSQLARKAGYPSASLRASSLQQSSH